MKNSKHHCRLKKMHRLAPGCKYDYHLNASLDLHKRSVVLKMNIKSATQSAKSVCRTRLLAYLIFTVVLQAIRKNTHLQYFECFICRKDVIKKFSYRNIHVKLLKCPKLLIRKIPFLAIQKIKSSGFLLVYIILTIVREQIPKKFEPPLVQFEL